LTMFAILGFFVATFSILPNLDIKQANAYISLFWGTYYVITGIWTGVRMAMSKDEQVNPGDSLVIRWVRRVERYSRPRWAALFHQRWMLPVFGLIFIALAVAAGLAPPFSGLDTLPAMGAIAVALAIIFEDVLLLAIGFVLGTTGVVLIVTVGAALVHVLRSLV